MPLATGVKVEIEFTAGTWTDVTADFDYGQGYVIKIGRSSPQQQPQPGSLTLRLRNPTGKYTPGLQVLTDGTAAPHFPNVTRRKRIRVSITAGVRFLGFIKSWSPVFVNGVAGYSHITASDLQDRASRVVLANGLSGEILNDSPAAYWPLSEPVGSLVAADGSGANLVSLGSYANSAIPVFGVAGPDGVTTGISCSGSQLFYTGGGGMLPQIDISGGLTVTAWVQYSTTPGSLTSIVSLQDTNNRQLDICALSTAPVGAIQIVDKPGYTIGLVNSPNAENDGKWHHVAYTMATGTSAVKLYIDGVLTAGVATGGQAFATINQVVVGAGAFSYYTGNVAHVAVFGSVLTATQIRNQYLLGQGTGELVSDKVKRFLTYAGLTSADWNVDTSTVLTGPYPQGGKDVITACQDMATTEGGGSVVYVLRGIVQFRNRAYRKPAAATITVDSDLDLDRTTYQPTLDDSALVNRVTVSRNDAVATVSTQIANNLTSQASTADGLFGVAVTSYASTDGDALNLAQSIVASGTIATHRYPQVAVDLLTAKNNLYAQLQATGIGDRLRVSNLPAGAMPANYLDSLVEGWTESCNVGQFLVVFDTSPADAPSRFMMNSTTYGLLQALPDCALNAALTVGATTVVIKSPTGPTFSRLVGSYPLSVMVGAEVITLNTRPSGSATPQTFTGVTRGASGTTAAAQASGATVTLWPKSTMPL